jgi:hypothetical protein
VGSGPQCDSPQSPPTGGPLRAWDYQRRDFWGRPASSLLDLVSGQMPVSTDATELDRAWPRSNASDIEYSIIVDRWYPFLRTRQPLFKDVVACTMDTCDSLSDGMSERRRAKPLSPGTRSGVPRRDRGGEADVETDLPASLTGVPVSGGDGT